MLLGRERELQAIDRLLVDARAGRSGLLALVGEAGIGKSALLGAAAERAWDMALLRARGVQSEMQIPFAGLFELLRPVLSLLDRIPAPQAVALESALALRPARADDRFAVGAATLSLLAAAAEERPVLVLVDDAHWLDESSGDALLFALRRLVADPIAVVATARDDAASFLDDAAIATLRLGGVDLDSAAALLPGASPEVAARLHRETGGNPLALLELGRRPLPGLPLDAPLPVVTSAASAFLGRARVLPSPALDALALAAATDRGDLALFARAASRLGLEPADLAAGEEAGLLALDGARLEFSHPLARSAGYSGVSIERRREIHRALAGALPDADADRRAWHLALAAVGPDETASSALEQAAGRAHERSAYRVASQAYERAALLASGDERRAQLLVAAADAAWLGGLADRTAELLEEAERFACGAVALRLVELRGYLALRRGPLDAGRDVLLAAARSADPATAARMLAEAVYGAFYAADAEGLRDCLSRVEALGADDGSDRAAFFTGMARGMALVLGGEGEAGAASIRAASAALERSDELSGDPRLLVWATVGPLFLREAGSDRGIVDRAVAVARERAAVGVLPHLLAHVAIEQAATDRWVEAQAGFDEAIRLARESGLRVVLAGALARLAWLEARLGREDACRAHADEALVLARQVGAHLCEIWALAALGELELAAGRAEAALERLAELEAVIERHGLADADLSPAPEQVETLLRLGRGAEAEAAAEAYARAAAAKSQPWARARAARCAALLAADDAFDGLFENALALHAETRDVFEMARTELAYGARLRRAGRRSDARAHLRRALGVFDEFGAVPWAELARVELAATGETARRRDPSTLDQLTPQELQVALLLAEGRTTKQAAASLFLSPKTIEYHLRNAYRKLAIHSRDELREALRSQSAHARD